MKKLAAKLVWVLVLGLVFCFPGLAAVSAQNVDPGQVPDGIYTGVGEGYNDDIELEVTVEGGEITEIEVISQEETPDFWEMGKQTLEDIIQAQSTNVDTETGATGSSEGIVAAVNNALVDEAEEPEVEEPEVMDPELQIFFNDEVLNVDAYIEDDRTYVDSHLLEDANFEVDEYPEVGLRQFFEDMGAEVNWDAETRSINITLVVEYKEEELLWKALNNLVEKNTFKLDTRGEMEISVDTVGAMLSISEEKVEYTGEEEFSIDPLKAYKSQIFEFPVIEFEDSVSIDADGYPLPLDKDGNLELEMVYEGEETKIRIGGQEWVQANVVDVFESLQLLALVDSEVYSQWMEVLNIKYDIGAEEQGLQAYELKLDEEYYNVIMDDRLQEIGEGISINSVDMQYELLVSPTTELIEQLNENVSIEFEVCTELLGLEKEGKMNVEFNTVGQSEFHSYGEDIELGVN